MSIIELSQSNAEFLVIQYMQMSQWPFKVKLCLSPHSFIR